VAITTHLRNDAPAHSILLRYCLIAYYLSEIRAKNLSKSIVILVEVIASQTQRQAGWFLRPDCTPSSERPHFRMPPVGNAPSFDRCTLPRRRFNQNIPPSVVLTVGFYGQIAPPGHNAPSSECPPNVVPNSEFRTYQIPNFQTRFHSENMNTPNFEFLNVPLCSAPMSYLAANGVVRCATGTRQRVGAWSEHAVLAAGA